VSGAGVGTDTLVAIEQIRGSDFADTYDVTLFTGTGVIKGFVAGFNEFEGMGGDDIIHGKLTVLSYRLATDGVTVDLNSPTPGVPGSTGIAHATTSDAGIGTDTIFGGVIGVFGSKFADTIYGSNNPSGTFEAFQGRGGDDYIDGRGGLDRATYSDPTGGDNPAFGGATSGVAINMADGTVETINLPIGVNDNVGHDTLRSIEMIRGTQFDDTYDASLFTTSGINGPNFGSAGFITIGGFQAALNEFEGEGGNDTIIGNGNTRLNFGTASAGVTVDMASGTADGTSIGHDTFTGVNAVRGSTHADTLLGDANSNILQGFDGSDTITGGLGNDTFLFAAVTYSTVSASDTITDFVHGQDRISLSAIDADPSVALDQAFGFGGNNSNVVAHSVTWFETGGNTIVQADVDGDTNADIHITLTGINKGLMASDFLL
jgi:Ca2+-binding RTX toxin-like protein